MKSPVILLAVASLGLTASASYAQQDGKDAKDIPVQQETKPVAEDEWQFSLTSYFWLPSALIDVSVPNVTVGNRTFGGRNIPGPAVVGDAEQI